MFSPVSIGIIVSYACQNPAGVAVRQHFNRGLTFAQLLVALRDRSVQIAIRFSKSH
jgi:hypothetical protein